MMPTHSKAASYIPAIDGLRALAVLAVIVNHYFSKALPSGFLGVDIFFVISGYVITQQLRQGHYTGWGHYLTEFYAKRIRRIFPALLLCVVLTSYAFLLLATRPSPDVFKTGSMALVGFSNNFLNKLSMDYFSLDARLNPFTHTWSLGVEEQFYLIFPALLAGLGLVRVGRADPAALSRRVFILNIGVVASLMAYVVLQGFSRNAAFYLLPARFWELGIGCLCFLYTENKKSVHGGRVSVGALFLLVALLFVPDRYQWISTVVCVFAASALLLFIRNEHGPSRVLSWKLFVFVGMLSYSLYLWHWSILVVGKWTFGETALAKVVCLALVVVFALLSYYLVERPFRYSYRVSNALTLGVALVVGGAFASLLYMQFPTWAQKPNQFLAGKFGVKPVPPWTWLRCGNGEMGKNLAHPVPDCLSAERSKAQPQMVYLIGDSHASHMYWAVESGVAGSKYGFRFLNSAEIGDFPVPQRRKKLDHLTPPLEYVVNNALEGDYVVISFHRGHLNEYQDTHLPLSEKVELNEKTDDFLYNARNFLRLLEQKKVKVIFVRDTPLMSAVATSTSCALQMKLFGESICRVTQDQDTHTRFRQDYVYDTLAQEFGNVYLWDPQPLFFGSKGWVDVLSEDGHYIMLDWNHITQWQSERLADSFGAFFKSTF